MARASITIAIELGVILFTIAFWIVLGRLRFDSNFDPPVIDNTRYP